MTKRKSRTKLQLAAVFKAFNGICHICGEKIQVGQKWQCEHIIPIKMGGEDGGNNYQPAHDTCHKTKTAVDVANIAQAKRREANHLGAKAETKAKIKSAGFASSKKQPRITKTVLPHRSIYGEIE